MTGVATDRICDWGTGTAHEEFRGITLYEGGQDHRYARGCTYIGHVYEPFWMAASGGGRRQSACEILEIWRFLNATARD